ncbi:BTAD domain-containing putative transcriptional regulator [Kitasatospora nipponensis]|uniref:BTAD domain-containing putative transcriptional regulator n=1 Tax=Kitasatospora nipponensis TaxID=258049 RepID=A0ABN1WG59_9ACTN
MLGPVTAERDGERVPLNAQMVRSLLGVLLVDAGQPVAEARLVEALWGQNPPASVKASLRNHVLRLRRLLDAGGAGGAERVRRSPDGYLIQVGPGELDLHEFDELRLFGARELRGGQWQSAADALSRALALWRGDPLADAVPARDEAGIEQLREVRLQAWEQLAQARLRLGSYDQVVADFAPLVREHPWREAAHGHLMHALHGAGRQADALAVYQQLRANLVGELGVEPSAPVAELHRRILAADPSLTVVARSGAVGAAAGTVSPNPRTDSAESPSGPGVLNQLPPRIEYFTGRADVLAVLNGHLCGDGAGGAGARLVTIVGTAGAGKTALAVQWAAELAPRFPYGCLYADLRGFDPGPGPAVSPEQVLRGFLRALGLSSARIPSEPTGQTALFRSLTAGRPLLVVLDNARDAEQVRPLLSGAPGSLTIVTSRDRLTGLVALDGARPVPLDLLTPGEAVALLVRRLGDQHAGCEPAAVVDLAELCARLPLALNIAAARIATASHLPLADFTEQLRATGERLTALDAGDPAASVRAVFSWSYRQLSSEAARVFRLTALHPGPDISVAAVASLAGLPVRRARSLLTELVGAHLVAEPVPGRYAFHDLLRVYAGEQAAAVDEAGDRAGAVRRMLDHYVHTAAAAHRVMNPVYRAVPLEEIDPRAVAETFDDVAPAAEWQLAERAALAGLVAVAAGYGYDGHIWRLADAVALFLDSRGDWQLLAELMERAVVAAGRSGDPGVHAEAHCDAAQARWRLGDSTGALAHLDEARDLRRELDDRTGMAHVERVAANIHGDDGRHVEELEHARAAVVASRQGGSAVSLAASYGTLAWAYIRNGQYQLALDHAREAVELNRQAGYRIGESGALDTMAQACYLMDRVEESLVGFQQAEAVAVDAGNRVYQVRTLVRISTAHRALGDEDSADRSMRRALEVAQELGLVIEDVVREALRVMDRRP